MVLFLWFFDFSVKKSNAETNITIETSEKFTGDYSDLSGDWATDSPIEDIETEDNRTVLSVNAGKTHTVKSGDTIYSIARQYGLNPKEVMSKNQCGQCNNISVGQIINL